MHDMRSHATASVAVTMHALERYMDRVDGVASVDRARTEIIAEFHASARQRERTNSGDAYFVGPRFRLVVAEERGRRTVLTVLPLRSEDSHGDDVPELAAALHAEYQEWEATRQIEPAAFSNGRDAKLDKLVKANEQLRRCAERRTKALAALMVGEAGGIVSKKRYDKQVEHAKRMDQDRQEHRFALKEVIALLLAERSAEALAFLRERMPGFVEHIEQAES